MAGGNSIFNVIVDTDDTAARLMDLLERKKLGRVTFMPLNTLAKRMSPRKELKEKVVAYLIEVRPPACCFRGPSCSVCCAVRRLAWEIVPFFLCTYVRCGEYNLVAHEALGGGALDETAAVLAKVGCFFSPFFFFLCVTDALSRP